MNRLAGERSPYLLQHAQNPVDWFPWGEDAFAKARAEGTPIFLSIGYSTCHWCHVMERESFENGEVAAVLNQHFVSIKVDREERPDVDRVYMTFVQATTGSGGWPMSVWLTPDLEPFYGGTYFPPTSRWGRPGFVDILREIARAWREERAKVVHAAGASTRQLRELERVSATASVPDDRALAGAVMQFRQSFDAARGGFGDAPKFPRPSELLFLLREHARTGAVDPREMALRTLRAMALGGMRDHVGGGFHRYSVDGGWRVPHFEKMLYDQAQLALAFTEAAQASGDAFYAEVADDTLQYVQRQMTDQAGGFYSAEDADSVPPELAENAGAHKAEGAFYLWRAEEIDALLGDDAQIVKIRFGVESGGNTPVDPQEEFRGKNILYIARSVDEIADQTGRKAGEVADVLGRARPCLFGARVGRPRPHLDDKVLTSWNGLMIAAFARRARTVDGLGVAGSAAGRPYLESARRAAAFIRDRMWNNDTGVLLRRYGQGAAEIEGYAEDYAYLIFGLLELFQADPDPAWLDWAVALQRRQDTLFWDEAEAGWYSTTGRDASVLLRLKEEYDGAEPTASSLSVINLIVLSHLIDEPAWTERVERTLKFFGTRLEQMARAVPMMAAALSMYTAGVRQVVIVGDANREVLSGALARGYRPFTISLSLGSEQRHALASVLPLVEPMHPVGDRAAAYVCRDFTCRPPVTTVEELESLLDDDSVGRSL